MLKTAVIYQRESELGQSNFSFSRQEALNRLYCERNGLNVLASFSDRGQSSYHFDRPDWQKLEEYVKKYRPGFLVLVNLDRFGRNLSVCSLKITELLNKYGVRVRANDEPLDMDDMADSTFYRRTITFMVAEGELRHIRRRTRDGMIGGALEGRHMGVAPYGYINARDEAGKPVLLVDEYRARHVQSIFRHYLAGASIAQVGRAARQEGYTQKGRSAIMRILTNPIYIGLVHVPADRSQKKTTAKGLHVPLVTETEYWRTQELLKGRPKIVRQENAEVWLRGVLRDENGKLFTAGNSRSKSGRYYWYYVGMNYTLHLPATRLHAEFNELLENLSFSTDDLAMIKSEIEAVIAERSATRAERQKEANAALKAVDREITNLSAKYLAADNFPAQLYDSMMAELQTRRGELLSKLDALSADPAQAMGLFDRVYGHLSNVRALFERLDLMGRQTFIRMVFNNGLMYADGIYRTPYLHPAFVHKGLILKQKGLLIVERPKVVRLKNSVSSPDGSFIEHDPYNDLFTMLLAVSALTA